MKKITRRIWALTLVGALLSASGVRAAAEPEASASRRTIIEQPSAYESGEVLVAWQDGRNEIIRYETEAALEEGLRALAADPAVTALQPNYIYTVTALSATDELSSQQWALSNDGTFRMEERKNAYPVYNDPFGIPNAPGQWRSPGGFNRPGGYWPMGSTTSAAPQSAVAGMDINAEAAWSLYNGGVRETVVALIDTGIDTSHEDLQNALWTNSDEIPGNGIDDDGNGYIDDIHGWNFYSNTNRIYVSSSEDAHGTHGAGTIAASANNGTGIAGIVNSPHVKLMALKALGSADGSGSTASIIQAIRYAEANGAVICNLSLGGSYNDPALYRAIAESAMLFVVAAGNESADTDKTPSYPASYDLDNIISVANLNYNGTLAATSNYGAVSVDLAAPGTYILSTTPGNAYSYMTGTSMSAPMVTAAAAMLYSHDKSLTLSDVKTVLLSTVKRLDTLTGNTVTGGMLDLGAAMAFDTTALPHEEWTKPEADSAPEISLSSYTFFGQVYLTVSVSDPDGDLVYTAYQQGIVDANSFAGQSGTAFSLNANGSVTFMVNAGGSFTFYAEDAKGHRCVETVTLTVRSFQPARGWW